MSLAKHLRPDEYEYHRSPYTDDPRPDLQEDHQLWIRLLELAMKRYGEELAGILNGFRCGGTRLKQGKKGYILRPDVDPTGKVAWESTDEYERMKSKYLEPWRNEVAELLKELS